MEKKNFSRPIDLKRVNITDEFWHREQELVRTEVIPYQWSALNDQVPGAAPSYCMHNFRAARRRMEEKRAQGAQYREPVYTYRGFESLPEDAEHPDEDKFYGFVFQDTDFSKWIEAVAYSLARHPDAELERMADEAIDIVCSVQQDNGYLDTYYIINGMDHAFTNLRDHHELYCLGHLVEGAVAYYQATGKEKLLRAACRFADYAAEYFGPEEGKCKGYPGHELAEMALCRLYEVTGEEKYLRLSRFFLQQRGTEPYYFDGEEEGRAGNTDPMRYVYNQAHKPVLRQEEAVGHAVRAVYLYSGMADVARLTEDAELYAACKRLWNSIVDEKLYITGGIGATRHEEAFSYPYHLPNDSAYSETCAAVGLVFFARRMLEIQADSRYADVMEMALYNTVLAGMALDGKSFFYVNPLEVVPESCRRDEEFSHVKPVRQKWFGCACCPPNLARLVGSLAAYAYTENETTLFVHLYVKGTVEKQLGNRGLVLRVAADMPWSGAVQVEIGAAEPADATLAFRIPGWCGEKAFRWRADGAAQRIENGYLYLTKTWQDGDVISLDFPMEVHMKTAHRRVRENAGKAAFTRGPVTYCMEEADNGGMLHLCRVDAARVGAHCEGVTVAESGELGHKLLLLKVPGRRQSGEPSRGEGLYSDYRPAQEEETELILIPYYAWSNRGEGEMSVWVRV